MVWYGQCVIGPPGSGKTTYCNAIRQFMKAMKREVVIVNLDPANDISLYDRPEDTEANDYIDMQMFDVDVRELVDVDDVMNEFDLGPNGALMYSMEFINENFQWLIDQIKDKADEKEASYLIIDCPGQVELSAVEEKGGFRKLIAKLVNPKEPQYCNLTCVQLIDSSLISDFNTYVSAVFMSLSSQVLMELPFVGLFSKVDLLKAIKHELDLPLRSYMEFSDIDKILDSQEYKYEKTSKKRRYKFLREMLEMVEDSNLMSFQLLDIHQKESMLAVTRSVDRANGFAMGAAQLEAMNRDQSFHQTSLLCPFDIEEEREIYDRVVERFIWSDDDNEPDK